MEPRKNNIITTYVVPIIGSLGSALDVTGDKGACYSMLGLSLALGVVTYLTWKKDRNLAKALLCCAVILFAIPSAGLTINHFQQKDLELLNQSLASSQRDETELLRKRADGGDGPALYSLAEYYDSRHEYDKSREYAQAAADNGNPRAYMLLAKQYTFGLGCPVDYSRAISNIISAQRFVAVRYEGFLSYMEERGYEISEFDREALTQARAEFDWILEFWTKVSYTHAEKGRIPALRLLNANYREILKLSAKGYIYATELLYTREFLIDPNPTDNSCTLAQRLYKVDRIPTGPQARESFFRSYYWDKQDSMPRGLEAVDRYIADNDYLLYSMMEKSADESRPYPDDLLVADYRIDRARYEWYGRIQRGEVPRVEYPARYEFSDEEDLEDARTLLENSISRINHRIDEYAAR